MSHDPFHVIEHEMAVLGRLLTARPSDPVVASMERSGYLILNELDGREAAAIHAIAEALMLDISTASRQIAALEAKGLIERIADPSDARASLLQITAVGAERLQCVRRARTALYRDILLEWSADDVDALRHTLQRLTRDMKLWKTSRR